MEESTQIPIQNMPPTPSSKPVPVLPIVLTTLTVLLLSSTTYLTYQNMQLTKQILNLQAVPTPSPTMMANSGNKTELSSWYAVQYPDHFYITSKSYNHFGVADNNFLGNFTHIPEAGIDVYTNVIPADMNLTDWVNGIGDPYPPVGPQPVKSCTDFINQLKQQLKYGDLFNDPTLASSNCFYYGVSNIVNKTVNGIPAIEFKTEAVSSSSTHTIFKYKNPSGVISLIDINYSLTGQSGPTDNTAEAYTSFISTFKPANPQ